jgi:hypothetical protein
MVAFSGSASSEASGNRIPLVLVVVLENRSKKEEK